MSAQTPQTDALAPHLNLSHQDMRSTATKLRDHARTLEADRDHYKALCEELRLALERTAHALELAFNKKPLRDMAETLAEARAALKKAEEAPLGKP